jgi:phosphatidylglycerol:prolipoprotein diacylglycerol transferase
MIALGFLAGAYAAYGLARKLQVNPEKVLNLTLISFIGGIVGARMYFCLLKWHDFTANPLEIFATWHGGMSIHGGMIGALIAGIIYCRAAELPVATCADILSTATALGQAIGRWGNFFNNELFGVPQSPDFPLKLYIPVQARPLQFADYEYFHPAFLYESAWDLLLFCFLYFYAAPKFKTFPGATFLLYLVFYSIGRIAIESIRCDGIKYAGIPVPIIASIIVLLVAVAALIVLLLKRRRAVN